MRFLPFYTILIFKKNQIKNQKLSLKNQKEIKKIKKSIAFYAIGDPPPPFKMSLLKQIFLNKKYLKLLFSEKRLVKPFRNANRLFCLS